MFSASCPPPVESKTKLGGIIKVAILGFDVVPN